MLLWLDVHTHTRGNTVSLLLAARPCTNSKSAFPRKVLSTLYRCLDERFNGRDWSGLWYPTGQYNCYGPREAKHVLIDGLKPCNSFRFSFLGCELSHVKLIIKRHNINIVAEEADGASLFPCTSDPRFVATASLPPLPTSFSLYSICGHLRASIAAPPLRISASGPIRDAT